MNLKKKEKYFWEKYFGISYNQAGNLNPVVKRLNFRDSELDDEELFFLISKMKSICQLDLDNTLVTDKGIQYLTKLESIKELRLKGCKGITQKCLHDLASMKELELLHLGSTFITLEDAKTLSRLQNLKLLLLSSDDPQEVIKKEASALRLLFPNCEININHKIDF
ncbi:MAG: hypothetical protein JWN78_1702 [Bacteroidota bacterium]|nr:hypothetical protein [Bacteroidota bacterium]